ncbi:hypothetical protein RF11_11310 [Thelohanellus kitauei]|uniref:Uncharacterized protein n=1 Tax=Thelohanellus kitauei TaxID=669202 RepID=A0A0C2M2D7_THEKT|nr:hypothetical protein RF11_11310 [Thelohanellus kitauei]
MNLSLGGWRVPCTYVYNIIELHARILLDNNGKDVLIHLTIVDSVINHQETAIINIRNDNVFYEKAGSIDLTNLQFIQYNHFTLQNTPDMNIKLLNTIPLLTVTKSVIECYVNSTYSYLVRYAYMHVTVQTFLMTQKKAGTKRDVIVFSKSPDYYIPECEENIVN